MQLSPPCQSRNSPHFTEPEVSLPRSQQPTTVPYPMPDKPSPHHHPTSLRSILSSCHLRLRFPIGLLPSGFPNKIVYALLFHTCYIRRPSHTPWLDHVNNIGEEYKSNSNPRKTPAKRKKQAWWLAWSIVFSSFLWNVVKFYRTARHHIPGSGTIYAVIFLLLTQVS
jgi:hypothetical protein